MKSITAVIYRESLLRTTSMTWLFFDLFMPLIYLLIFGIGFDRALGDGIVAEGTLIPYNEFFLGGILAMTSFGIGLNTSYGFFMDRDNGIFYEHLTYPMTRGEFLLGKVLFNCILATLASIIALGLGSLLLNIPISVYYLPLVFVGIIIGTAGWFFFLMIFALRIRRNDMYNTIINLLYFILLFASSLFYPLELLPAWLRTAALINPVTWQADFLRYFTIGVGNAEQVFLQSLFFLIFLGISFYAGTVIIRKIS
jgi:ABC-2 type transport system permease protein